jgi:hypothetical protein
LKFCALVCVRRRKSRVDRRRPGEMWRAAFSRLEGRAGRSQYGHVQRDCDTPRRIDACPAARPRVPLAYSSCLDAGPPWTGHRCGVGWPIPPPIRDSQTISAVHERLNVSAICNSRALLATRGDFMAGFANIGTPGVRSVLDAMRLSDVRGPRRVLLGGGLEYLLASGFPANAIVVGWPVPVVQQS